MLTPPSGVPATSLMKPLGGGILAPIGVASGIISVLGNLGAAKWRDDLLAKNGFKYSDDTGRAVHNPSTGYSQKPSASDLGGGQDPDVMYKVFISLELSNDFGASWISYNDNTAYVMRGRVGGIRPVSSGDGRTGFQIFRYKADGSEEIAVQIIPPWSQMQRNFRIRAVERQDGQPNAANDIGTSTPSPSGYTGTNGADAPNADKKVLPPNLSSGIGWGTGKPVAITPATLGMGTSVTPASLRPSPSGTPLPSSAPSTPSPSNPIQPAVPPIGDTKDGKKAPPIPKEETEEEKIRKELTAIGAMTALMSGNVTQIKQNTSFDNLSNAAKTGACTALKSPSCTKDMEDRIKDPISDKIDTKTGLLAANQLAQDGVLASIVAKGQAIQEFAEKTASAAKLDKVYNFLTYLTVTHNAAMLSNQLAVTLGDTLSLGLATFGIKDGDSPIDVNTVISSTASNAVKAVIGAENYTTLTTRWAQAVRVYQASANIIWSMRSLWDSARALQEMTGANVGELMNSLRKDGVVSENAYGAKPESPVMVNGAMTKLQNLEEAASHLSSITSTTYGITETTNQLKKDKEDFDKLLKESPPVPKVENDVVKANIEALRTSSVSPVLSPVDLTKPL